LRDRSDPRPKYRPGAFFDHEGGVADLDRAVHLALQGLIQNSSA
jgi:hypothetical protein